MLENSLCLLACLSSLVLEVILLENYKKLKFFGMRNWPYQEMSLNQVSLLMYLDSRNLNLSNQTIQLLQKCLSLFLWYLHNCCPSVSEISHWGNLVCPWSNTIGFIKIGFTNLYLWSFSQSDLLQDCSEQRSCTACHVSLFHILGLKFGPQKLQSVPFVEHLQ